MERLAETSRLICAAESVEIDGVGFSSDRPAGPAHHPAAARVSAGVTRDTTH